MHSSGPQRSAKACHLAEGPACNGDGIPSPLEVESHWKTPIPTRSRILQQLSFMDADSPQSPFPSDFQPLGPVPYVPPPEEPEQPRLGIIHLMVWTACVAVHLSIMRSLWPADGSTEPALIPWMLSSVGGGAALGGLLLWAARRIRGERFPRHPGEYLLIVEGLCMAFFLAIWTPIWIFLLRIEDYFYFYFTVPEVAISGLYLVQTTIFLWAAVKVRVRRWRWFFLAWSGTTLLSMPLLCCGVLQIGGSQQVAHLVIGGWLVAVVLKDHFQGLRFPWTHWLGVAIRFWLTAASLGWFLWQMLLETRLL
jgi:hypothetical protein